jgi:hypothetical protein
MVIRYNYIKKINKLFVKDTFYKYWLEITVDNKDSKLILIHKTTYNNNIYFFRYFYWILFSHYNVKNYKNSFLIYLKYYKFLINYIHLLNYFKINNISYYNLFYKENSLNIFKKNKKIQRKLIKFLIFKKATKVVFLFKQNNFKVDFFYNSLNKSHLNIYELNVLNPKLIFFFFYLNFYN